MFWNICICSYRQLFSLASVISVTLVDNLTENRYKVLAVIRNNVVIMLTTGMAVVVVLLLCSNICICVIMMP